MQLFDKLYLNYAPSSYSLKIKTKDFKNVETCSYFGRFNRDALKYKRLHESRKRRKEIKRFASVRKKLSP